MSQLHRRSFLQIAALGAGGLMLGVMPGCANPQQVRMREVAQQGGGFAPSVFLTITPAGRALIALNKAEMGQGVMTGAAVLIAEELEIPLDRVDVMHAARPEFETSGGEVGGSGVQITGGSSSTPENFLPMRRAGATARELLITAAARKWGASRADCAARDGAIHHKDGRPPLPYGALTRAAAALTLPAEPPALKPASAFRIIGKDVTRVDARMKVNGAAIYGADLSLPGMVRALVIRPPRMGAQVATLDASKAKQSVGVVDIFAFERGVAVVAKKYWQARAAARLVEVTWRGGESLDTAALRADALARLGEAGDHTVHSAGDVDEALAQPGVKTLDVTYEAPYLAHAPMEPMNCTVWVRDGRAQVWAPNQSPTLMAEGVSRALGIGREDVTVETLMLGGGFGRRAVPDFAVEAALIARRVPHPVQVIWSREDDTRGGYYRPGAVARMRGAVDSQGRVTALSYHGISQSVLADQSYFLGGVFPEWMPRLAKRMMTRSGINLFTSGSVPDPLATEGITDSPYTCPHQRVQYTPVRTRMPVAFWRSVGHSFNGFMHEVFWDELAHLAGADPVAFREAHLKGQPRHLAVLREAARLGQWGAPIEAGWGRGVAVHKSFGTIVAHVIEAGIVEGRIRVRRVSSAIDCGLAITPDMVRAQVESAVIYGLSAAIDQEITLSRGEVQQGNFDTYPALRMFEAPEITVSIIPSTEKPMGVGEPGLPPAAAALSNALFAATRVRLRTMPLQRAWDAHLAAKKETP